MNKIVYFDTKCFYCNSFVLFILDRSSDIYFSGLDSGRVKPFLDKHPGLDSVVYEESGEFYTKTTAVIKILKQLGAFWYALAILYTLIPKFLRNWEYDLFARYRYRLAFGEKCRLFTEEEKKRFLPKNL